MSYNLLKGKKGIIFGALDPNSIAWITAERVHEEGGTFVLTNAPVAMRMGQIDELAKKTNSKVISADATSLDDLQNLITGCENLVQQKIYTDELKFLRSCTLLDDLISLNTVALNE